MKSYHCSRGICCLWWCKQSLLFSNSHTLLQFSDKSYWSNGRVRARRKIIDFISQTLLSWHSLKQEHTITHQRRYVRTSPVKSSDDTAIEHDRSDLQTRRVSKQRHHLASSWCKNFGLEHRHVAASVESFGLLGIDRSQISAPVCVRSWI